MGGFLEKGGYFSFFGGSRHSLSISLGITSESWEGRWGISFDDIYDEFYVVKSVYILFGNVRCPMCTLE